MPAIESDKNPLPVARDPCIGERNVVRNSSVSLSLLFLNLIQSENLHSRRHDTHNAESSSKLWTVVTTTETRAAG